LESSLATEFGGGLLRHRHYCASHPISHPSVSAAMSPTGLEEYNGRLDSWEGIA